MRANTNSFVNISNTASLASIKWHWIECLGCFDYKLMILTTSILRIYVNKPFDI